MTNTTKSRTFVHRNSNIYVMLTALAIWGGFVAAMYALLWLDTAYYRYNVRQKSQNLSNSLRQKFQELMTSFTEED